jgi:Tat protein translocase TatB subunit
MFNLGLSEIVLISIIALIFIGPKQLPEIARAVGRALNELKRASEDLTSSITNPKHYEDPSRNLKQTGETPVPPPKLYDGFEESTHHESSVETAEVPVSTDTTKKDGGSTT